MDDLKKLHKQIASQLASGKREPDFFEVVRLFEQHHPAFPRVGYAGRTRLDALRFGQVPSLRFMRTAMDSLQETPGGAARLLVNFFGLCGVNGPLPLEFTSLVFQRSHNHYDRTLQCFLDIINHPFLRLYYRAYADHAAAICCDRDDDNILARFFQVMLGQPTGISDCMPCRNLWIGESDILLHTRRSAGGLRRLLVNALQIPVSVEERVTGQYEIPRGCRCLLGRKENACLGMNTQIGRRFISNTRRVVLHFGPLSFARYVTYLPGNPLFSRITFVISRYFEQPREFDFAFRLKTDTLPPARLDASVALGRSVWLGQPRGAETAVRLEADRIFSDMRQKRSLRRKTKENNVITGDENTTRRAGRSVPCPQLFIG